MSATKEAAETWISLCLCAAVVAWFVMAAA